MPTETFLYPCLLICGDCGNPFVPKIRYWNGNRRSVGRQPAGKRKNSRIGRRKTYG